MDLKDHYFKIGSVYCWAIGFDVYFDEHGFRHFLRKSSGVRPIKDQLRRFKSFRYVVEILTSPAAKIIEYSKNSKGTSFCAVADEMIDPEIKVILRKTSGTNWHYYSVIDYKQK